MERTVTVAGKGKLSVAPDTARITISMEGTRPEYSDTLHLSSERTEELKTELEKFGFARKDLKTLSFSVDPVHERYKDKESDKRWKFRLTGYRFNHRMKLEFPTDRERLGRLLYALSRCEAKPTLDLAYTVADPEAVKNQLLRKAMEDSRQKAEIIAEVSGMMLRGVISVDYSWSRMELVSRPMDKMPFLCEDVCCDEMPSIDLDVVPDDIDLSDSVSVVWEIG